jgi:dTDP-glucose 4,6-dehydratase
MKKNILVTGGAGFIGRSLVTRLLQQTDWDIVVIDSLTYAGDPNRLADQKGYDHTRVRVLWHDLRAPINDWLVERIGKVNYIANVASESHVDRSIVDPAGFFMSNCALAANMLEYARRVKPEVFLQISTDEVYGPAASGHAHKEWETHVPSNPYAASKSAQESLAISYWRTFGVPVIITNTMNNFGESQHPEKFVPLCVKKIQDGDLITVHGANTDKGFVSGSRFWLHADNHADALIYILQNLPPISYPAADRPGRWHIAGDREISNLEIVQMIANQLGIEAKVDLVDFHSSRPGHDLRYGLNGDAIAAAGWLPPVDFETSFLKTVEAIAAKNTHKEAGISNSDT